MTSDRAAEISNHVSEEFNDLGKTDFATKKELCECIQWFQRQCIEWNNLHQELRGKVITLSLETLNSKQHP